MVVGGCWGFLVVLGGSWYFLMFKKKMIFDVSFCLFGGWLVILGVSWCFLVVLVIFGGS